MGCGGSKLKGEPVADIGSAPVPVSVKKTATNFSTVDYDSSADRSKSHVPDRAPHELDERTPSTAKGKDSEGSKLEPYHTLEDNAISEPTQPAGALPSHQTFIPSSAADQKT
jgi:hypothetical protein